MFAEGDGAGSSIADMLRAAATEVLVSRVPPGFVYIEEYGQYYSQETGYYYDQNTTLFFHPDSQTYYYYDDADGQYKVHACLKQPEWRRKTYARHAKALLGKAHVESMMQDDIDVCEVLFQVLGQIETPKERRERHKMEADELRREQRIEREQRESERMFEKLSRENQQLFDGEDFVDAPSRGERRSWHRDRDRHWDRDREERGHEYRRRAWNRERRYRNDRGRSYSCSSNSDDDLDEHARFIRDEGLNQPPCLRFLNNDTLELYVVTMSGALVGSALECDVKVNDSRLPPRLAQIIFKEKTDAEMAAIGEAAPGPSESISGDNVQPSWDTVDRGEAAGGGNRKERRQRELMQTKGRRSLDRTGDRRRDRDYSEDRESSRERDRRQRSRSRDRDSRRRERSDDERRRRSRSGSEERPKESRKQRERRIQAEKDAYDLKKKQLGKYLIKVISNGAKCTMDGEKLRKEEDKFVEIYHGCSLMFSKENAFTVHIHFGRNTCASCEPGLLQAERAAERREQLQNQPYVKPMKGERARKEGMRRMKKDLGLYDKDEEEEAAAASAPKIKYVDRAKMRRANFGSEMDIKRPRGEGREGGKRGGGAGTIYDGCEAKPMPGAVPIVTATDSRAAAKVALTQENKGFKLLKAMGWKEGDGLGRTGDGRVEPVANALKSDRAGLGAAGTAALSSGAVTMDPKQLIWEKTRNRFKELEDAGK